MFPCTYCSTFIYHKQVFSLLSWAPTNGYNFISGLIGVYWKSAFSQKWSLQLRPSLENWTFAVFLSNPNSNVILIIAVKRIFVQTQTAKNSVLNTKIGLHGKIQIKTHSKNVGSVQHNIFFKLALLFVLCEHRIFSWYWN